MHLKEHLTLQMRCIHEDSPQCIIMKQIIVHKAQLPYSNLSEPSMSVQSLGIGGPHPMVSFLVYDFRSFVRTKILNIELFLSVCSQLVGYKTIFFFSLVIETTFYSLFLVRIIFKSGNSLWLIQRVDHLHVENIEMFGGTSMSVSVSIDWLWEE